MMEKRDDGPCGGDTLIDPLGPRCIRNVGRAGRFPKCHFTKSSVCFRECRCLGSRPSHPTVFVASLQPALFKGPRGVPFPCLQPMISTNHPQPCFSPRSFSEHRTHVSFVTLVPRPPPVSSSAVVYLFHKSPSRPYKERINTFRFFF